MSLNRVINMKLGEKFDKKVYALELINTLTEFGWKIRNEDKITYLPLEDNDEYNWQCIDITKDELSKIIRDKEINKEIIGVILKWQDNDIGISILLFPDLNVSFSIDINRKMIKVGKDKYITDINWYVERTVLFLKEKGYLIEWFNYEEY